MTAGRRTRRLRTAVRSAVAALGTTADRRIPALHAALTRGLTVFIFHDITATPSEFQLTSQTFTRPEAFREQVAWMRERFTLVDPLQLPRLGGTGQFPANAAMITFDDAWAGVFRVALPLLREQEIGALCFLNMGTVDGDPDLAVVRRYEAVVPPRSGARLGGSIDLNTGARALAEIGGAYRDDAAFRSYQGAIATLDDLRIASSYGNVWFGSHLYHHWDVRTISKDVYEDSYRRNEAALAQFPNRVPAFAPPHGYAHPDAVGDGSVPVRCGARAIFTGVNTQNRAADARHLDRISFPTGTSDAPEWWFTTHNRRVLGPLARLGTTSG